MKFEIVDDNNFILYAMKHYDNPQCKCMAEFYDDLNRIKYCKRLFRRYVAKAEMNPLQLRLLVNHIIVLYNVFGVDAAPRMLFCKIEKPLWSVLKTILLYLNFMPEEIKGVMHTDEIPIDTYIHASLRKL
jgi:hypothetical protein